MAAPLGNRYWRMRSKHGRDLLFESPELLWEAACEYFTHVDQNPWKKVEQLKYPITRKDEEGNKEVISTIELDQARPYSLAGLVLYCGASENWWKEFRKNPNLSEDFLSVIERIEHIIKVQQFDGATIGAFHANIISRTLGLSEKVDNKTELTGKDGQPIQTESTFNVTLNLTK